VTRTGRPKSRSHGLLGNIEFGTPQDPSETEWMQHKVLIVDDSKLARMVMASALRRIRPEWQLIEATNAEDAVRAIASNSIDIALVDFNMPGVDGLELVAKLRKARPTMPVALVSANLQDEIINRTRELNAAFVPKPLTDEALGAFLSGAALRLKVTNEDRK
jgi:CheY-like chemotaxis protein